MNARAFGHFYRIPTLGTALLLAGSIFGSMPEASAQNKGESITEVDGQLIVDCKLPSGSRKMGNQLIIPVPGKLVRVSKAECEIRGGEYVAFDASDPAKALKIWKTAADSGDITAQNRVGQIYELGVGTAPDYAEAAKWYLKSSQGGSRAATVNLASLYDRGLGVPQNDAMATQLMMKAQGAMGLASSEPAKADAKASEKSPAKSDAPKAALVDVGPAASKKPSILLQDPKLYATRGEGHEVKIRGDVRTKDVIGWVTAPQGLASVKVNGKDVQVDRFGFFASTVQVNPEGTKVNVLATDRKGDHSELSFRMSPASNDEVVTKVPAQLGSIDFGNYYALVIGNRRYKDKGWEELPNSESDARAVAAVLERKYGFRKPKVLIDASRSQIMLALNDYAKTLGPNDNLLIYYAGHGAFALGKRGYWIPVDGAKGDDSNWIDNVRIGDLVQKMNARKVMVISDSCYSGAIPGAVASLRDDLSDEQMVDGTNQLATAVTRMAFTSGGLAPVLEEGVKDHSAFAHALLDVLDANDAPIEGRRLYLAVLGPVTRIAQQKNFDQRPTYEAMSQAGHEGGDFILVPKGASGSKRAMLESRRIAAAY